MRAYNAGAYRAATVALWIAVIHDLTSKIRILAESDDNAARVLIQEIEAARNADAPRKMQTIENSLLDRGPAPTPSWSLSETLRRSGG